MFAGGAEDPFIEALLRLESSPGSNFGDSPAAFGEAFKSVPYVVLSVNNSAKLVDPALASHVSHDGAAAKLSGAPAPQQQQQHTVPPAWAASVPASPEQYSTQTLAPAFAIRQSDGGAPSSAAPPMPQSHWHLPSAAHDAPHDTDQYRLSADDFNLPPMSPFRRTGDFDFLGDDFAMLEGLPMPTPMCALPGAALQPSASEPAPQVPATAPRPLASAGPGGQQLPPKRGVSRPPAASSMSAMRSFVDAIQAAAVIAANKGGGATTPTVSAAAKALRRSSGGGAPTTAAAPLSSADVHERRRSASSLRGSSGGSAAQSAPPRPLPPAAAPSALPPLAPPAHPRESIPASAFAAAAADASAGVGASPFQAFQMPPPEAPVSAPDRSYSQGAPSHRPSGSPPGNLAQQSACGAPQQPPPPHHSQHQPRCSQPNASMGSVAGRSDADWTGGYADSTAQYSDPGPSPGRRRVPSSSLPTRGPDNGGPHTHSADSGGGYGFPHPPGYFPMQAPPAGFTLPPGHPHRLARSLTQDGQHLPRSQQPQPQGSHPLPPHPHAASYHSYPPGHQHTPAYSAPPPRGYWGPPPPARYLPPDHPGYSYPPGLAGPRPRRQGESKHGGKSARDWVSKDEAAMAARACYVSFGQDGVPVPLPRSMLAALADDFRVIHNSLLLRKMRRTTPYGSPRQANTEGSMETHPRAYSSRPSEDNLDHQPQGVPPPAAGPCKSAPAVPFAASTGDGARSAPSSGAPFQPCPVPLALGGPGSSDGAEAMQWLPAGGLSAGGAGAGGLLRCDSGGHGDVRMVEAVGLGAGVEALPSAGGWWAALS